MGFFVLGQVGPMGLLSWVATFIHGASDWGGAFMRRGLCPPSVQYDRSSSISLESALTIDRQWSRLASPSALNLSVKFSDEVTAAKHRTDISGSVYLWRPIARDVPIDLSRRRRRLLKSPVFTASHNIRQRF